MKKIFSFLLMSAMLLAVGASVVSCSSDDEDIWAWSEKWQKKRDAYWGEWHSRLQGIWIREGDEGNPNAPYLYIGKENIYSCCFFNQNRTWNGIIAFTDGCVNRVNFCRDVWSTGIEYELSFIGNDYRRMEAYYLPGDKKYKENREVWVKIDKVPSAWPDVIP